MRQCRCQGGTLLGVVRVAVVLGTWGLCIRAQAGVPADAMAPPDGADASSTAAHAQDSPTVFESVVDALQAGMAAHREGRIADARHVYQAVLSQYPDNADALHLTGVALMDEDRLGEACVHLRRAVALDDETPMFHFSLGQSLRRAARQLRNHRSVQSDVPSRPDGASPQGVAESTCGSSNPDDVLSEARTSFERALDLQPDYAEALASLGDTLFLDFGLLFEALPHLRRAAALQPASADNLNNLGAALVQAGALDDADAALQQALQLEPDMYEAHATMGALRLRQGRLDQAVSHLSRAVAQRPAVVKPWHNLAATHHAAGRESAAAAVWRHVLDLDPLYVEAHVYFGNRALRNATDYTSARRHFEQAIASAEALGDAARAVQLASRAELKVTTSLPVIFSSIDEVVRDRDLRIAHMDQLAHDWVSGKREPLDAVADSTGTIGFEWQYHGLADAEARAAMSRLHRAAMPTLTFTAPHCTAMCGGRGNTRTSRADTRVRVGFASRFFSDHSVAKLTRGVVCGLPREMFHVSVVFLGSSRYPIGKAREEMASVFGVHQGHSLDPCEDDRWAFHPDPVHQDAAVVAQLASRADALIEAPTDIARARVAIAELELDVLVYPEIGMDVMAYFLAHTRVAPVQVAFWGHPITTGITSIDYFVVSRLFLPAHRRAAAVGEPRDATRGGVSAGDERDDDATSAVPLCDASASGFTYTERLVCLRSLSTHFYRPPPVNDASLRAAAAALQARGVTHAHRVYLLPQYLGKVTPTMDDVLEGIVQRDSLARIVLLASPGEDTIQTSLWTALVRRWRTSSPRLAAAVDNGAAMAPDGSFPAAADATPNAEASAVVTLDKVPQPVFIALSALADVVLDPAPVGGGVTSLEMLSAGAVIVTAPPLHSVLHLTPAMYELMGLWSGGDLADDAAVVLADSAADFSAKAVRVATEPATRARLRDLILERGHVLFSGAAVRDEWAALLQQLATDSEHRDPQSLPWCSH